MAMRSKLFFAAIATFWVVMNVLLWRSQSAAHSKIGSAVPIEVVWDKILTAPDNSSLDVYDHDKKIGFCQWTATVGSTTEALKQTLADDYEPDGSIPAPTGYSLSLDGNTAIFATNRVRFGIHLRLATNQTWQDFHLTAKLRPTSVDVHAIEAAGKVVVKVDGENGVWQRVFKFSELEHPETLLAEAGLNGLPAGLMMQNAYVTQNAAHHTSEAHEDWMQFGHSRVQVYRLETVILGQHLFVFTSRVGEILWVEGPNKLTLRNEAFSHF
jgi:hypothetical protein